MFQQCARVHQPSSQLLCEKLSVRSADQVSGAIFILIDDRVHTVSMERTRLAGVPDDAVTPTSQYLQETAEWKLRHIR